MHINVHFTDTKPYMVPSYTVIYTLWNANSLHYYSWQMSWNSDTQTLDTQTSHLKNGNSRWLVCELGTKLLKTDIIYMYNCCYAAFSKTIILFLLRNQVVNFTCQNVLQCHKAIMTIMILIITHKMNIPEDHSRYSSYLLLSTFSYNSCSQSLQTLWYLILLNTFIISSNKSFLDFCP